MDPNQQLATKMAVLEANMASNKVMMERLESTLLEKIADLRALLVERLEPIEHVVYGNAKPGLIERVGSIENRMSSNEAHANKMWTRLSPFVPFILATLGWAALYYLQQRRAP